MLGDDGRTSLHNEVVLGLDFLQELHVSLDVLKQRLEFVNYGLFLNILLVLLSGIGIRASCSDK